MRNVVVIESYPLGGLVVGDLLLFRTHLRCTECWDAVFFHNACVLESLPLEGIVQVDSI